MKYIYRVENKDKIGCYSAYLPQFKNMYNKHNSSSLYPAPLFDKGIKRDFRYNEICGFLNKKQTLNWFNKRELIFMARYGFILKKVRVNKITAIGEKQVLAIR